MFWSTCGFRGDRLKTLAMKDFSGVSVFFQCIQTESHQLFHVCVQPEGKPNKYRETIFDSAKAQKTIQITIVRSESY
jgi:hypothetical protein